MVVLGSHSEEIKSAIGNHDLQFCVNENYLNGMLSSAICGFRALPQEAKAALVFLGDQPQIPPQATEIVVKAWMQSKKGIIMPAFKGRRGHPVLIEKRYKFEIEKLDPERGLRTLSEKYKDDVFEVECDIPEILKDIDTPEEYELYENSKIQTSKTKPASPMRK